MRLSSPITIALVVGGPWLSPAVTEDGADGLTREGVQRPGTVRSKSWPHKSWALVRLQPADIRQGSQPHPLQDQDVGVTRAFPRFAEAEAE